MRRAGRRAEGGWVRGGAGGGGEVGRVGGGRGKTGREEGHPVSVKQGQHASRSVRQTGLPGPPPIPPIRTILPSRDSRKYFTGHTVTLAQVTLPASRQRPSQAAEGA